jgi:hypothetical protein
MKHLFKLKNDNGKTVGYLLLKCGTIFRKTRYKCDEWTCNTEFAFDWATAHPFVTTDKNGKDVFEGDKIYVFNKCPVRVIWSATHRGWAVQLVENPKGLPMSMSSFYPRDTELIEDK